MITDEDDSGPSAEGILQCLRLLAEEAAMLKLGGTLSAIEKALETVMAEGGQHPASLGRRDSAIVLH